MEVRGKDLEPEVSFIGVGRKLQGYSALLKGPPLV